MLAQTFGFRAIPNGLLVGSDGVLNAIVAGGFDIRRPETRALIRAWWAGKPLPAFDSDRNSWMPETGRLLDEAVQAFGRGDRPEAIRLLEAAFQMEPDNYIIRKQLWAMEHPERFYGGAIDQDWQRQRLEEGR